MNKTVLIVDDELLIRTLFSRLIGKLGYSTMTASNGAEALDVFKEHSDEIDAVILDMVMPDINGDKVFGHLRDINPTIKILLSTGYSEDEHIEDLIANGNASFIQKPFTIETITPVLKELLES